jgi:hypothetical protein
MRNRRLLTLAVLAVAVGVSAYAQAASQNEDPYGIAVLTVIKDPNVGNPFNYGTFSINVRLWDDAGGIGVTAQTPGLLDFVIKTMQGTGGVTIDRYVQNIAPYGVVSGTGGDANTWGGGFSTREKMGIRYAGRNFDANDLPIENNYDAVGYQPVAYDANGTIKPLGPNTLRDAAILYGVGTTGRAENDANTQNGIGTWSSPPGAFDGDTPIISGKYTGDISAGNIAVTTWGTDSFDVLPGTPGEAFIGPAVDANTFGRPVRAVVVITTSKALSGLDGGKNVATVPSSFDVQAGNVILGTSVQLGTAAVLGTPAIAKMALIVSGAGAKITLGSSQIVSDVQIATGNAGTQAIDLKSPAVSEKFNSLSVYSYGGNAAGTSGALDALHSAEVAITSLIALGVSSGKTEGIFDSLAHPDSAVGVTDQAKDLNGDQYVLVRSTVIGDADCNGTAEFADLEIMTAFWQNPSGSTWDMADFDGNGVVEFADLEILTAHWQAFYTPEPASMLLLAMGAVGVLARRRRK